MGYDTCTHIQELSIPVIMQGEQQPQQLLGLLHLSLRAQCLAQHMEVQSLSTCLQLTCRGSAGFS